MIDKIEEQVARQRAIPVNDRLAIDERTAAAKAVNLKLRARIVDLLFIKGELAIRLAQLGAKDDGAASGDQAVPRLLVELARADDELYTRWQMGN
jgi:hypothetical protein